MTTNNSINVATAASGTMLQGQGIGTADAHSTSTWPATTVANQLLYSSATNAVGGLSVGTTGQLLTGVTSGAPIFASTSTGNFTFTNTVAGTAESLSVTQTDNTNTASHANINIATGGTSGGDAYVNLAAGSSQAFAIGLNHSASEALTISQAAAATTTPSGGTPLWKMTTGGIRTLPKQPCFYMYLSGDLTNITGDGVGFTIPWDTVLFDRSSNCSTVTHFFTCPVAGIYQFVVTVRFANVTTNPTNVSGRWLVNGSTTNSFWQNSLALQNSAFLYMNNTLIYSAAANDTIGVNCFLTIAGGKIITLQGTSAISYMAGYLIA